MKPFVFYDKLNDRAVQASKEFKHHTMKEADVILVLGGDGTMIKAIHAHHKAGLPFYGINYGHVGFLLNEGPTMPDFFVEHELPLLKVWYEDVDGLEGTAMAVNDIWVERATSQTARMQVLLDEKVVLPNIYADGLLVCTPQGSTAYARAMGAAPIPLNSNIFQLVGSNVSFPNWKTSIIGMRQHVTIQTHEKNKRPIDLFADGQPIASNITKAVIFKNPNNSVILRFDHTLNLADKISSVQFPK